MSALSVLAIEHTANCLIEHLSELHRSNVHSWTRWSVFEFPVEAPFSWTCDWKSDRTQLLTIHLHISRLRFLNPWSKSNWSKLSFGFSPSRWSSIVERMIEGQHKDRTTLILSLHLMLWWPNVWPNTCRNSIEVFFTSTLKTNLQSAMFDLVAWTFS